MNRTKIINSLLFLPLILLTGCKKEEVVDTKQPGTVEIEFDNIALINNVPIQLQLASPGSTEYPYENAMGQQFNINLLRYFISKIELTGPNGESFTDPVSAAAAGTKGYYLIDESDVNSQFVQLKDVPAGTYTKLTFTLGVDVDGVQEGAVGGILDPATNHMFWNWNSGYIAVKMEGQADASNGGVSGTETLEGGSDHGIAYHVGGWKDIPNSAFVYNNKRMSFDFDVDLKVERLEQPHVHMYFDVLKLFSGVNSVDFTGNHNIHKPIDGVPVAENMEHAFQYDHIHQ